MTESLNAQSANPVMRDVNAFHERFGIPRLPSPGFLSEELEVFRVKFMAEELKEYTDACYEGDLAKAADALIDLVYVALGTIWMQNLPFDALWNEVQRANMAKVRAASAGESKRATSYDVVKPPGWTPPDIDGVLEPFGVKA